MKIQSSSSLSEILDQPLLKLKRLRRSVNAALSGVIGNPRVPTPDYGGNTTTIDVRKEQQDARVSAYLTAIQQGKSEEQAQNISASVGNNVGAAALARAFGTTGVG